MSQVGHINLKIIMFLKTMNLIKKDSMLINIRIRNE